MRKAIPNTLTLLNLFCGCIAVIFTVKDDFVIAAIFVFLGIFFDFFDGFAARKLNVQSELGLQLDSLADVVTSGVVPGLIMFKLLEITHSSWDAFNVMPFLGLSITLASAYRLAKFNIDEEQQNYFKGLPTPANALLILSLPLIMEYQNNDIINGIILNKWFLLAVIVFSCYILNASVKLFALKFKNFGFADNVVRYVFLILSLVLIIVLQFAAIPLIILLYISLSILNNFTSN
ncbi:CDP-diacylglycerol--serine O-phosphatidyltransferase [Neotamlana laminarinivorans]|uniref:CDP-diacylglycerol--serine O-phosphatidyltransferase n=1 Tax=Neotamlana laminarinivorans TaxID=2883124 RepID=A0A9X1L4P6_9FLAO|nr:CDP-diacylglycerol--serine O-phosphatidyltransferase [Tamlana laminarinivorans]MCB4799724.1 CDP-diacylglycerol--serine O-phosphatidyltransferase [Tamlana laminarinivorans]